MDLSVTETTRKGENFPLLADVALFCRSMIIN